MPEPVDEQPVSSDSSLADRWLTVHSGATTVDPPAGRYVVLAPHPDDEVLTTGGLIARLLRSGADVRVGGVTDGGNAYPHDVAHDDLARVRRTEQAACLAALGLPPHRLTSMGLRDGSVADDEDALVDRILAMCTPATTLVAPWTHDVHPDHEAVGRAARRAASVRGCTLWFSVFWAWHHAPPQAFDSVDLLRVELDDDVRATKREALRCHASQLDPTGPAPVLDVSNLEPAQWDSEYFIQHAPGTDHP